ncbi:MAG: PQQ-binding-like beta-propeller repeat protein [Acidimicrobiales bacterium]
MRSRPPRSAWPPARGGAAELTGSGDVAIDQGTTTTEATAATSTTSTSTTEPPTTEATTTTLAPFDGWVDPASSGLPWSALGANEGLLTFRGNPTRTFYGQGPVPTNPKVLWTFDIGCSNSSVGGEAKQWCGSGWTGQPSVFHPPGAEQGTVDPDQWWVAFGGYNRKVNFLDPATGAEVYPAYATDDIIKGSITMDPDGYPLMYTGSRDNNYHVVAIDGPEPRVLWKLAADLVQPTKWNNDWDGSGLIIDDYLFEGGENSRFFIVKLNRGYDADGNVTVDPQLVFTTEGWDAELIGAVGNDVSIENSVAISGNTVYFANSGGLVQGWDITSLADGVEPTRVFRFWTGDDTDASVVIDDEGMLYVGSEYERGNARSKEIGQVMKLDPSKPDDPLVWSREANNGLDTGVWATPALYGDLVIVPTDDGRVLGLDRMTGAERWVLRLPGPLWQSPVVVDGVLIQGDCEGGLHAFDLSDTTVEPPKLWDLQLEGCIESTPAVWDGRLFFGSRTGTFYAIGEA